MLFCWYAATNPTSALPIFMVAALFGTARAFVSPAVRSIPPLVAPEGTLPRVMAIYAATWQVGLIIGPASSGLLYDVDPAVPYAVSAACFVVAGIAITSLKLRREQERTPPEQRATWHHTMEGLRFVRGRPVLLGAIALDLFAVLFGGAVALLPAIAEDRLHVGNVGYGWLRAAPGVGAVVISALLAIRPLRRRIGRSLLDRRRDLRRRHGRARPHPRLRHGVHCARRAVRGGLGERVHPRHHRPAGHSRSHARPRVGGRERVHRRLERGRRVRERRGEHADRGRPGRRARWRADDGGRRHLVRSRSPISATSTRSTTSPDRPAATRRTPPIAASPLLEHEPP